MIHPVILGGYEYEGEQTVAVSNSAVSLTVDGTNVSLAVVVVDDAIIRFKVDGTAPTSSDGQRGYPGDSIILPNENDIANFQAIRKNSSNAELNVIYYRKRP